MLGEVIGDEGAEQLKLKNRVDIRIGTASYRGVRGYTYAAIICDEIAIWRSDESTNPDIEVLRALRPGMLTIPTSILIMASSALCEVWRIVEHVPTQLRKGNAADAGLESGDAGHEPVLRRR